MSDTRVCNTADLLELNRQAIKLRLNRTADPDWLELSLDPDGNHILAMRLYGHNMDTAPILHHRTQVLAKAGGTMEPLEFYLDVPDSLWTQLKTAEEVTKVQSD